MKKLLKRVLVVSLMVVAVLVAAHVFLGGIVTAGVRKVGPRVVGVPVSLDKASVSLLKGNVDLDGFVIGNPEGYKSEYAFSLSNFAIDMEPKSMFGDEIVIREIVVDSPKIIYELSLKGSNLGAIVAGLKKDGKEPSEKEADDAASRKSVRIADLFVRNAQVTVTSSLLRGKGVTLALPEIHLSNLGGDEGGIGLAGATELIVGTVLKSVVLAAKDSGGLTSDLAAAGLSLAGDFACVGLDTVEELGRTGIEAGKAILKGGGNAVKALTGTGGQTVKTLGEGAGEAVGNVSEDAGKAVELVGEMTGKGVEAAGDVADKGVKAVGSAAKDGADKVLKSVGNLFKKEDE